MPDFPDDVDISECYNHDSFKFMEYVAKDFCYEHSNSDGTPVIDGGMKLIRQKNLETLERIYLLG